MTLFVVKFWSVRSSPSVVFVGHTDVPQLMSCVCLSIWNDYPCLHLGPLRAFPDWGAQGCYHVEGAPIWGSTYGSISGDHGGCDNGHQTPLSRRNYSATLSTFDLAGYFFKFVTKRGLVFLRVRLTQNCRE